MGWFKKIRHGFNLVGNKIINAKVDNPTDNEHISNKQYVDLGDKYDTILAQNKTVSTKFNWVNNVGNKPIKEALDKLLFPVVYPTYLNPELKTFEFKSDNEINFYNSNVIGKIVFNIDYGDRTPTTNFKLIIKKLNEAELIFESITNTTQEINFNFNWKNIEYIKLQQVFSPVTIKNDSDGNPYINNSFNTTYDYIHNFDIQKIEKELNIKKQIYYKLGENESTVTLNLNKTEAQIKQEFILGNTINLVSQLSDNFNNLNSCTLLIHESQINILDGYLIFKDSSDNFLNSMEFLPKKYVLKNNQNEMEFITLSNNKYFLCFIENFGKFTNNVNVIINL